MAIRARADNLSLDYPADERAAAPLVDFAEVWAHREVLRQACVRLTGDVARAEDLVQDTFVSALKSGDRLDRGTSIGPWLATVARRRSIDEIRGRQRVTLMPVLPEVAPTYADDPADHVLNQELVAQLRAAVGTLTDRERQLLLRQATYGMSLAELAAEEQTSVASVRSVLARARQKLRMTLERNGALGVLPVPRVLASLREKLSRWAVQFESSLPALAGASAHFGNVVVAVVAAIATMLAGTMAPIETDVVAMVGHDVGLADGPGDAPANSSASRMAPAPAVGSAEEDPGSEQTSTTSTVPGLIGGVTVPTLPPDSADQVEESDVYAITASDDGQHLFAAANTHTAEDAIYKSTDGGTTWTRLPAKDYKGGRVVLSPNYPADQTLFAAGSHALHRSDDGGTTFTAVAPSGSSFMMSPGYGAGDDRILTSGARILEYWSDGTLNPIHGTPPGVVSQIVPAGSFAGDGAVLVSSITVTVQEPYAGAVYRCTPTACSGPVVVPGADEAPTLWRASSGALFAWTDRRILRSDDDGATFTQVSAPNFTVAALAEEADGDILMAARKEKSPSAFYRSSDNGVTWSPLGLGTVLATTSSNKSVIALPGNKIIVGGMVGGGIRCSTDDGATWATRC